MNQQGGVVAVVPARAGSKAVPRKNVRRLGGLPLVAWSIRLARTVPAIDRVIVSTDGSEIAAVAREHGAEVSMRPDYLSTDSAIVADTIRAVVEELRAQDACPEVMLLLEPTSPFRTRETVDACIGRLRSGPLDSVATFTRAHLNPHRAWKICEDRPKAFLDGANPWLPRQELPAAYQLNGAVYAFRTDKLPADGASLLFGSMGVVMTNSYHSMDIDNEFDFIIAETIVERGLVAVPD